MSKYLLTGISVKLHPRSKRAVIGEAMVDTAAPFTTIPLRLAEDAGLDLSGPLSLEGDISMEFPSRVITAPESNWHHRWGYAAILGSDFLQPVGALIDYSTVDTDGNHIVRCRQKKQNPADDEIFEHDPDADREGVEPGLDPNDFYTKDYELTEKTFLIPGLKLLCPRCNEPIRVSKRGIAMLHKTHRGIRCPGSGFRFPRVQD